MAKQNENLIIAENVSKKFSSKLGTALWYGLKDLTKEITLQNKNIKNNLTEEFFTKSLRKDEFWAVKNSTFKIKRGECYGLIGKNGAGKTTLLRMLNGLIKPDTGKIQIKGKVGALIALGAGFNPVLTGRENIFVNASILGMSDKQTKSLFDEIVEFAEVSNAIDSPVATYSSGMQARLGYACAALLETDIIFIDEVLAVGDLAFQRKCIKSITQKKENGAAIIFVSHNMQNIESVSDKVILMNKGAIDFNGIPSDAIEEYNRLNRSLSSRKFVAKREKSLEINKIICSQISPKFLNIQLKVNNLSSEIISCQIGYSLWNNKLNTRITTDTSGWSGINYYLEPGENSINYNIDISILKSDYYYLKGGLYCVDTTMPLIRFGFENNDSVELSIDTSEINKGKRNSYLSEQDDIIFLKTYWNKTP